MSLRNNLCEQMSGDINLKTLEQNTPGTVVFGICFVS